jgi:exopolysaccharide biosynthesis polyprenyl glycosylphosphotransferase
MSPRSDGLKRRANALRLAYRWTDALVAGLAYTALYGYRKAVLEPIRFGIPSLQWENTYFEGLIATVIYWALIYRISGIHREVLRKSRLSDVVLTLQTVLLASIPLFAAVILDDDVRNYQHYYWSFAVYLGVLLPGTLVGRYLWATWTYRQIRAGKLQFPTLLIGSPERLLPVVQRYHAAQRPTGNVFAGWLSTPSSESKTLDSLPHLGSWTDASKCIERYGIEEVMVALVPEEHGLLESILLHLEAHQVRIQWVPDTLSILTGQVKLDAHGVPLVDIKRHPLPAWQESVKRGADVFFSSVALVVLSPLLVLTAFLVSRSSPGPVLYRQERVGLGGKTFKIIKFRSMYVGAEAQGPQLSSDDDPRITPWGKIMRKYRLDELPQFWNVWVGEMSLVGPRPERPYYAQQLLDRAPHYAQLYKLRPGITSWGMVRYGYASDVNQMLERMEYDLVYLENVTLFADLKVLVYTVLIVLQGRGK